MSGPEKIERTSAEAPLLEQLRALFPEVITDGRVDVERLRALLGDAAADERDGDGDGDHYGLRWPGKARACRLAAQPPKVTLRPVPGAGVDEETTKNAVIIGDNLQVLLALRKSYANSVKLVYIDPPYNTGNDFVYKDTFASSLDMFLVESRQADVDGRLVANPKSSGRFHSNWLNFIYPRLRVARSLLQDDGLVFVSINDSEVHNLRLIMDEIFGAESFIACLIWKSRQNKDNRTTTGASVDHEYVLCYGRRIRGDARNEDQYSNPDGDPRGPWTSANMVGIATKERRPNLHYDLVHPETGANYGCPSMGWRYDRSSMARLVSANLVLWPAEVGGRPRRKKFLAELDDEFAGFSSVIGEELFTKHGTADVERLLGSRVFDFPKPVDLLAKLIEQGAPGKDDLVLDFFAGSGTTGEAVLRLNSRDGGNRQFILVQVGVSVPPDSTAATAGYSTVDEITRQRLRLVATKLKAEGFEGDVGFKVFREDMPVLANPAPDTSRKVSHPDVQLQLFRASFQSEPQGHVDLVTEVLLLLGFPLDTVSERLSTIYCNTLSRFTHPSVPQPMILCLDGSIDEALEKHLLKLPPHSFVCRDESLSDVLKLRLNDALRRAGSTFKVL